MAKQIFPEKISISSIRLLSGNIDVPQDVALSNPPIQNYATNFEADFRANQLNKTISYFLKVSLQALNEQQILMPIKAEYSFEFIYSIENFEDYVIRQKPEGGLVIELVLVSVLAGLTYSTVRGMIVSRTEGTILKGVILPVIDPKSLITHKLEKSKEVENP